MRRASEIILATAPPVIVVLSATAGTTDGLLTALHLAAEGKIDAAQKKLSGLKESHLTLVEDLGISSDLPLISDIEQVFAEVNSIIKGIYYLREKTPRAVDAVVSNGEILSSKILFAHLSGLSDVVTWLDIRQVMRTNDNFGAAQPLLPEIEKLVLAKLLPLLKSSKLIITQGFIGATAEGLTTTLGRGGSDYSAAILGNVTHAEVIEIWTDVSGVMTADPRVVPAAFPQPHLSFKEAAELAYFGAKVLHPSTILPAMQKNIPVQVRNTHQPREAGTTITSKPKVTGEVKAITFRKNITMITVESTRMLLAYGFLEKIFDVFAKYQVSVDLISTSEISVSLTLDNKTSLKPILKELKEFSTVSYKTNQAILSLIGEEIKNSPQFLWRTFGALKNIPVEMITFGASNVNLSLVMEQSHIENCVRELHREFFEKD